MGYRRRPSEGRVRRILPDLRGKDVELLAIEREDFLASHVYHVRLRIDGLLYRITRSGGLAYDELDVMRWLMRLRDKGNHHEEG
jgi:hypothetical protein